MFFRTYTEGLGSDWPLSRKFGAHTDIVYTMILQARDWGLEPFGLSFHVGSQQRDIGQWDDAISKCRYLFESVASQGIKLNMINLGGGLPANYLEPTLPLSIYASEIHRFLYEDFGDEMPEIWIEPGRALVGDAGVIVSEVVLISRKAKNDLYRWVYLDIGVFGGLIETLGEAIKYPSISPRKVRPKKLFWLALLAIVLTSCMSTTATPCPIPSPWVTGYTFLPRARTRRVTLRSTSTGFRP